MSVGGSDVMDSELTLISHHPFLFFLQMFVSCFFFFIHVKL